MSDPQDPMAGLQGMLGGLMEQAMGMRDRIAQASEEAAGTIVTGAAGGDLVSVDMTGKFEAKAVHIDERCVEDLEMLEDLLVVAINDAVGKARNQMKDVMGEATGGLQVPGLDLNTLLGS